MALRAYIQSIEFINDIEAHIIAVVTDDIQKTVVDITISSLEDLKQKLRVVLNKATEVNELRGIKENDVIDLTSTINSPNPGNDFFNAWGKLQSELAKVDAGILAADDKRVSDARALTLSLDNSSYLVGRR